MWPSSPGLFFEPQEGKFDLAWLERAVNLLHLHGIAVILGTPSAAPPPWLTQKYPEVLMVNDRGLTLNPGARSIAASHAGVDIVDASKDLRDIRSSSLLCCMSFLQIWPTTYEALFRVAERSLPDSVLAQKTKTAGLSKPRCQVGCAT